MINKPRAQQRTNLRSVGFKARRQQPLVERLAKKLRGRLRAASTIVISVKGSTIEVEEVSPMKPPTRDQKPQEKVPIWKQIAERGAKAPEAERQKLPKDLAANVDHYLYGAPKKDR